VLYENPQGVLSNGQGEFLFAGRTSQLQGSRRRTLMHFDLASQLPPAALIVGAELNVYLDRASSVLTESVSCHRVLQNWGEGASQTPGGGGGGDTAEADDATWLHTFYDTAFWATPGGDFSAQASATLAVDTATGFKIWTSSSLVDDAILFSAFPDSNFGWVLVGNEDSAGSVRKFASRENTDSTTRPFLRLYVIGNCPIARTGDVNGDYQISTSDIIVLVNFVFKAGSAPLPCVAAGDAGCNGGVTSSDIIYLVNTVFRAGPAPCDVCSIIPSTWSCN
jgi:hypothetical protein